MKGVRQIKKIKGNTSHVHFQITLALNGIILSSTRKGTPMYINKDLELTCREQEGQHYPSTVNSTAFTIAQTQLVRPSLKKHNIVLDRCCSIEERS